ncbi:hypothetical protein [Hanamia caeni]|jgi:hypothetical protein|nr:hypothetical protein [Hanamia caeni]
MNGVPVIWLNGRGKKGGGRRMKIIKADIEYIFIDNYSTHNKDNT